MILIIASVFLLALVLTVLVLTVFIILISKKYEKIYFCRECYKCLNIDKLYSVDDKEFVCMNCIKKSKSKINRDFYDE